jgi:threonine/homoserine/homoserine lactone efflux protein
MTPALSTATLVNGLILGWSVAWPPGPVNAEMIRRGLLPPSKHGGFWGAWQVGLGACTGDFAWALGVSAGAGALINTPTVRLVLGIVSLVLLLFLAGVFARGAWRTAHEQRASATGEQRMTKKRREMNGYVLGLMFTLTSPFNIGFWLAVIGSQSDKLRGSFAQSVLLAASVVLGAMMWGVVLSVAVKLGAHIFSRPGWQIGTQVVTALVMLYFAARLVVQLLA